MKIDNLLAPSVITILCNACQTSAQLSVAKCVWVVEILRIRNVPRRVQYLLQVYDSAGSCSGNVYKNISFKQLGKVQKYFFLLL